MKEIVASLLLLCFFSNVALADCDFSKGITAGPNDTFIYSGDCHRAVGKLVQDNATKDKQLADLGSAIQLKDLALTKADQRTQLWMDTSDKMQDKLQKVDELKTKNEWLYFALGAVATSFSVFVAAKAIGR